MTDWLAIGRLSGSQADGVAGSMTALAEVLRGSLREVLPVWNRLPIVLRTEVYCTAKGRGSKLPFREVDLTAPAPDLATVGRQGSFLLLDLRRRRHRLTVVLYDWDELRLDASALTAFGVNPADLTAAFLRHARSSDHADRPARWRVQENAQWIGLTSGVLDDDQVSPVVGRLALGELRWDRERLPLEVLALPRLSFARPAPGPSLPFGDPNVCEAFLNRTVRRRGSPSFLLALLRLAHRAPLSFADELVSLSGTDDPSPLAWLALAEALDAAAAHQRRQYVRRDEDLSAPTGTLRFNAYVGNVARLRSHVVPVTRHILSHDCLENRVFRGVAAQVRRLVSQGDGLGALVGERFRKIEAEFDRTEVVTPEVWMCDRVLEREPPPIIADGIRACRQVLTGHYAGVAIDTEEFCRARSFELDISKLFEEAMRAVLAAAVGRPVRDGNEFEPGHQLRWRERGTGKNSLRPDMLVMDGEQVLLFGDAKYKREVRDSSYAPLGRSDFQQVCTYLLAWPSVQRAVVLLPDQANAGAGSRLVAALAVGGGRELGVFLIDAERWLRQPSVTQPLSAWLVAAPARPAHVAESALP